MRFRRKMRLHSAAPGRRTKSLSAVACIVTVAAALSGCSYLPDFSSLHPNGATVSEFRSYIEIRPSNGAFASTGLMFIPGGLVDPHVYIEALAMVATQGPGYAVVIPKEPANLAVLDANAALRLTGTVPGVRRWVLAGHSLGGVIAGTVVNHNRAAFAGLVLEASYPAGYDDLSNWGGSVLSISASDDGLSTPQKIAEAKPRLPAGTDYEVISGGIHSYFGSYGPQSGDGKPTISRPDQQSQAAVLIGSFLGTF